MFLHERLVSVGGRGVRVRRLGGNRAGEMQITRFLRNGKVTQEEMVRVAFSRTADQVAGREVLAIQDTTDIRVGPDNRGIVLHPTIAVDAASGMLLGLVHAELLRRRGGTSKPRRGLVESQSRRWLTGAERAGALAAAGAARVTVVADRECDMYEEFALRPAHVELLVRAAHDRRLADGGTLFGCTAAQAEAGRMVIDLPAAPGRRARQAQIALRIREVEIVRPERVPSSLPESLRLRLVEACEIAPPAGVTPAHWRLLTTHQVAGLADAVRMVGFYRQRWTIEQLFRTLKSRGFDIERLSIAEDGPFEKLATVALIAAITVMQMVYERDGAARRPLNDAFDPADRPLLEAISSSLEGKTARQKNPHPRGSLAFAAWVFARLGGWTGYYGKPGPIVILQGLLAFQETKRGWKLRNV